MKSFRGHLSDGRSAGRWEVEVRLVGEEVVVAAPEGLELERRPVRDLRALEEVFPGQPVRLEDRHRHGFHLTVPDPTILDELARADRRFRRVRKGGASLSGVIRWGLVAVAACTVLVLGLPHAAAVATPLVPYSFERSFGDTVRRGLTSGRTVCAGPDDGHALQRLADELGAPLEDPAAGVEVRVAAGGPANAFAAPGGQVVFFEELLGEAEAAREVAGVLAHEMGHVTERHSMRHIVKSTTLSLVVAGLLGDASAPMARAVDALATLSYSRSAEAEADDRALELLSAGGYDSRGLVEFFERMSRENPAVEGPPQVLSTHPAPSARVERVRDRVSAGRPPLTDGELEELRDLCR